MLGLEPERRSRTRSCSRTLGFDRALEVVAPARRDSAARATSLRVVAWNAQRCRDPEAAAAMLRATGGAIFLLSELDRGMARTRQRDTAARARGRGSAAASRSAVEFLELGLGDAQRARRARGRGERARLSRRRDPRVRRVAGRAAISCGSSAAAAGSTGRSASGAWADASPYCVGCRSAGARSRSPRSTSRVTPIPTSARRSSTRSSTRSTRSLPARPRWSAATSTRTRSRASSSPTARCSRARSTPILAGSRRRSRTSRSSRCAERRGFEFRACNAVGTSTERRARGDGSARGTLALDWFFARGLECSEPAVIDAVDPASGAALSDHEAISVTIRCR